MNAEETNRMHCVWQSFLRLAVEEAYPDRYSVGSYLQAFMHATQCPADFKPERLDQVKTYIRDNWPEQWEQYQALVDGRWEKHQEELRAMQRAA